MDIREKLEDLREKGDNLVRCCAYEDGALAKTWYGKICIGPIRYSKYFVEKPVYQIGYVYNGGMNHGQREPSGMLKGTELSRAWLEFMLDPEESPWKKILPHVVNKDDIDWINDKGGFILERVSSIGTNLLGSFLIATRFAQEKNYTCAWWHELYNDYGLSYKMALAVAMTINSAGTRFRADPHYFRSGGGDTWVRAMYHDKSTPGRNAKAAGCINGGNDLWFDTIMGNFRFPDGLSVQEKVAEVVKFVERPYE